MYVFFYIYIYVKNQPATCDIPPTSHPIARCSYGSTCTIHPLLGSTVRALELGLRRLKLRCCAVEETVAPVRIHPCRDFIMVAEQ